VARGGVEGVLWDVARDGVLSVHQAIADLAARAPEADEPGETKTEHVLEQYHASRTIRRLIINPEVSPKDSKGPSFAATLWATALKKKCRRWAKGHRLVFFG
jgi:pumilio family protein 6